MKTLFLFLAMLFALFPASPVLAETLRQAVEASWARNPEIAALTAKRENAISRQQAARAWFAGPPAVSLSHVTDQVVQDKRARSTEGELSVPLWLPGEGTATERVADADLVRLDAQVAAVKLKVAGEVREAVYAAALAGAEADIALQRVQTARALEADVARRSKAGDVALLELDLAKGESLDAQVKAREKQAEAAAALTRLKSLTGLASVPSGSDELLVPSQAAPAHPRLQAADRAIDAARAALRLAVIADRDSPEIGVVASRNRDIRGPEYDAMVGIRLKIPFAAESRNAPRRTAAQAELAAAQAERDAALRDIEEGVETARQSLASTQDQAPLMASRVQALRQASSRLRRSYDAGEIGLSDLLRSRTQLYDAEGASAAGKLAIARARARVNQAAGLVP